MNTTEQITSLTLAAVLTGPGIPVAAILIRQVVEYLQWGLAFFANWNARVLVFALTFLLYLAAWIAVGVHDAEGAFAAILTWVGCGMATMGMHELLSDHKVSGLPTLPKATEKDS